MLDPTLNTETPKIVQRFRGFLPVVVDVETAGFNAKTDALLELAGFIIGMDERGHLYKGKCFSCHIAPFPGANLDPKALEFNGIDPFHPFRFAISEKEGLEKFFQMVNHELKETRCSRAILVGHNPFFDLSFLNAAITRTHIKQAPFHQFSTFDTATLAGLAYGQTVLARAVQAAGLQWDHDQAHSAVYDADRTAELFCKIVNQWEFKAYSPGV